MQKCRHLKYLRNKLKVGSKGGRRKDGEEKGTYDCFSNFYPSCQNSYCTCDFNYAEEQQGLLQLQEFSHLRFNAKIDYLRNYHSQY